MNNVYKLHTECLPRIELTSIIMNKTKNYILSVIHVNNGLYKICPIDLMLIASIQFTFINIHN